MTTTVPVRAPFRPWRRLLGTWPAWAAPAAACWSLLYAVLGACWALGAPGYPFTAVGDDRATGSIAEGTDPLAGGAVIAVAGLLGAAVTLLFARGRVPRRLRLPLLGLGWAYAAVLCLAIPDYTPIAVVAFAPLLVVFAFTGIPGPQGGIGDVLYWHRDNLLLMFAGGVLWAAATLAFQRRTRAACVGCGRGSGRSPAWTRPDVARRWGRWAVRIALLCPLPYEVTRVAWFLGVPLGISDRFLAMMQGTPMMLGVGLGCAVASVGGGILTHGLVARWGETFPRWFPLVRGRRVPPALAVVPASVVALCLVPAGLMMTRVPAGPDFWGVNAAGLMLTPWGLLLGAATYAYHLRRRGRCRRCDRTG